MIKKILFLVAALCSFAGYSQADFPEGIYSGAGVVVDGQVKVNATPPIAAADATRKDYVDSKDALKANLAGGNSFTGNQSVNGVLSANTIGSSGNIAASGNITANGNVTGTQVKSGNAPVAPEDTTRKDYVDGLNSNNVKKTGETSQTVEGTIVISKAGGLGVQKALSIVNSNTSTETVYFDPDGTISAVNEISGGSLRASGKAFATTPNESGTPTADELIRRDFLESKFLPFNEFSPTKTIDNDGLYNSFPGICEASNGDLIIVYRKATEHEVFGLGDIVIVRSADKGYNWTTPTVVLHTTDLDYRDPSLKRLADGSIIMSYFTHTGGDIYSGYQGYTVKSTDNGLTWGTPVMLSGYADWNAVSSPVVQLPNGNLLLPVYGKDGALFKNVVYRSTNLGVSWNIYSALTSQTFVTDTTPYYTEPVLFLMQDNTVMATLRNDVTQYTSISKSTNSGLTWSAAVDKFVSRSRANVNQGLNGRLIFTYRQGGTPTELFPAINYSDDNGETFGEPRYIPCPVATIDEYSALIDMGGGICGYAYAVGNDFISDMYFRYIDTNYSVSVLDGLHVNERAGILNDGVLRQNKEIIFNTGSYSLGYDTDGMVFNRSTGSEIKIFDNGHFEVGGNGVDKGFGFYNAGTFKTEGVGTFVSGARMLSSNYMGFGGTLGDEYVVAYLTNKLSIFRSGNEFNIYNNGNTVIGSATDTEEKLQVNGKIKASDLKLTGLPVYANEAAAIVGGLATGDVYQTATGELRIKL